MGGMRCYFWAFCLCPAAGERVPARQAESRSASPGPHPRLIAFPNCRSKRGQWKRDGGYDYPKTHLPLCRCSRHQLPHERKITNSAERCSSCRLSKECRRAMNDGRTILRGRACLTFWSRDLDEKPCPPRHPKSRVRQSRVEIST